MDDDKRVNEQAAVYTTVTYDDVLSRAQHLTLAEQIRLLEELAASTQRITSQTRPSILELQGLGKEIWQDIDAQRYIEQERASWNG